MRRALLAAVAAGLAWTLAHPPVDLWWLILLVVPLWVLAVEATAGGRARDAVLVGLVTAGVAFLPMVSWLTGPATLLAPLLLALALGAYLALTSLALQPWADGPWAGVIGAALFAGFEVVRGRWPLGGFGWGDLATAHADGTWMLGTARVLGADGLTLLTALLGGVALDAARRARHAWVAAELDDDPALSPGVARVVRAFDEVRPRVLATLGIAVLGTLITVGPPEQVGEADVLVVQGYAGVPVERGTAEDLRILEQHVELTTEAVEQGGVPDLTVWAENSIDADPTSERGQPLAAPLARAAEATEGRLLAGLTRDGPRPDTFRNQVVRVRADGSLGEAYDKINIVPFGEYVPWRSVLGDFGPLRQVPRDALPGSGPVTHTIDGIRVASIICFETLFPSTARAAVAHEDANLLVAVTNDSSFGETAESAQHVAQSQLRAVETGRSVVHASISGTSALIEPDGEVIELGPLFETATIRASVPLVSGSTPAATVAPVVSGVLAAAWLAGLALRGALVVRNRRGTEAS